MCKQFELSLERYQIVFRIVSCANTAKCGFVQALMTDRSRHKVICYAHTVASRLWWNESTQWLFKVTPLMCNVGNATGA